MRIALVHDWLLNIGGAERVLKVLHEMFPEAPIYTLFHNPKFSQSFLPQAKIISSFAQSLYRFSGSHKWLLPLLPAAIESFDLSKFDLVISSSVTFAKGLVLRPRTKHLCYCYSPTRMLWDWHIEYQSNKPKAKSNKWKTILSQHLLRLWDLSAASRPDKFIAISQTVQQRIKKYYGVDSEVIYPPVEIARNSIINYKLSTINFFLIVSRLHPHKNIDIAIEAFNKLELPLVIVGSGPDQGRLKKLIQRPDLIKLTGFVPDSELPAYYQNAKAFIMPQEEDFGLTPLEAMSYGKPVLALEAGGALEYIKPGMNGEFFFAPKAEILADGVRRLNENYAQYNPEEIKKATEPFGRPHFEEQITEIIKRLVPALANPLSA